MKTRDALAETIAAALSSVIDRKVRRCPECGGLVEGAQRYFCGPRCYARFHRVPGQLRKLLAEKKRHAKRRAA
jgi:ribosomal protein S27AE